MLTDLVCIRPYGTPSSSRRAAFVAVVERGFLYASNGIGLSGEIRFMVAALVLYCVLCVSGTALDPTISSCHDTCGLDRRGHHDVASENLSCLSKR